MKHYQQMNTYFLDWGNDTSNGSRYALIQARSHEAAFLVAEEIGDTTGSKIALLTIPYVEEVRPDYLEIKSPRKPYAGITLKELAELLPMAAFEDLFDLENAYQHA